MLYASEFMHNSNDGSHLQLHMQSVGMESK